MEKSHKRILRFELFNKDDNKITSKGVKSLIKLSSPCLASLGLSYNRIGDEGVSTLLQKSWRKLKNLYLNKIDMTLKGFSILMEASFPLLIELCVGTLPFT